MRTTRNSSSIAIALFALSTLGMTGCESMSNTAKDGLIGGGVGAGVGAAIGSASGHTGAGALIGGLAGTAVGGIVGNDADQKQKKDEQMKLAAAQARPQVSIEDVRQMVASGTADDVIINQIRVTGSVYSLTAADIQYLQQNGVSQRVIMEMQNSRFRQGPPPGTVVVAQPPPPGVVYVQPGPVYVAPPPPPPVGFGFTYFRH